MLCQQCGEREANVNLTQIANDSVQELHLCERCAAERGIESPSPVANTPLGSFIAAMGKGAGTGPEPLNCPGCGGTLADFKETGRLGCGECYVTFSGKLGDLLRRLHGSMQHVGERYAAPGAPVGVVRPPDVTALRQQLRDAIDAENFELAADLRDRLRHEGAS